MEAQAAFKDGTTLKHVVQRQFRADKIPADFLSCVCDKGSLGSFIT